ncbi:hypothetical protein [Chitinilyticum litopenaei]|uniref:hypothetical protein n=1 Tax=Chitinilyticum litopenaei TaxID=1121276 RepID=UPI0004057585|nr:hypothetical protein [Chitinilyticum litopenaei]
MFTPASIDAIETLFRNAIREHGGSPDSAVTTVAASARNAIVLSISSYLFKIVLLFDFPADAGKPQGREPAAGRGGMPAPCLDARAELVNMICGSAKRGLGQTFPHVGMSTPILIDGNCLEHVAAIAPDAQRRLQVAMGDGEAFACLICLFAAKDSAIDFRLAAAPVAQAAGSGELELF